MTRAVVTAAEDASLEEIATLLERHRIKRVPVLRDGKLVGIVSRANLLHGLASASIPLSPARDESALRHAVLAELREAGADVAFLNVVMSAGVVHLWGAVQFENQRRAAVLAAQRTPGVAGVEDHLGVLPAAGVWGI
jgi:CBS-domain-containing membrane protein